MGGDEAMTGTVYGLGVGPGDPELITLKALRLLRAAPVLAYPAPEQGDSLARAIAAPHLPGGQVELAIRMPLQADRFPAEAVYDRAAAELGGHLDAGRDVAVLCEGDGFFYGSFMYLHARLAARYPVQVVPGVCSLGACAAAAGLGLAARDDVLTVLPAPLPAGRLAAALDGCEAAAVIKVGRHLGKVREALAGAGLLDHAVLVERATMAEQRVRPLAEVREAAAPYFSMVLAHRRGRAWR
jgi:precorrin-2/cobalt-factor-2 C20-methyltransferase